MTPEDRLVNGIVGVYNVRNQLSGTGFVVSEKGLIVTCTHVLEATAKPDIVTVVFYATKQPRQAQVEVFAVEEDVTILRVAIGLPEEVEPLPLGFSKNTTEHPITTFGFPKITDEGYWGKGKVIGPITFRNQPMLQMQSEEVTGGYSGAPVWDNKRRQVIGMAKKITLPDNARLSNSFMAIPTETLQKVCPNLLFSPLECPYRDLEIFTENHTRFFFGREEVVETLVNKLRMNSYFLAVLGPSGSGKSSVVQAGLMPIIRQGKVRDSSQWEVIITHPDKDPFKQLRESFRNLVDKELATSGKDLAEAVDMWLQQDLVQATKMWLQRRPEKTHIMLIIDQFEELFTICSQPVCQEFVRQFTQLLAGEMSSSVTAVIVMRDDFYNQLVKYKGLADLLAQNGGPYNIHPALSKCDLLNIVREPALAVGFSFEDHLEDKIVSDAIRDMSSPEDGKQSAPSTILPLLEVALTQLWKHCQSDGLLTYEAYDAVTSSGKTNELAHALIEKANQTYLQFPEEQRSLVSRIFVDLVHMGDRKQGIPDSRERKTIASLAHREGELVEIQDIALQLVKARLLVTGVDDLLGNEEKVEYEKRWITIIHEALIRTWPQLRGWIENNRAFRVWEEELRIALENWEKNNKNDSELLHNISLDEAKKWLQERGRDLDNRQKTYIFHSIFNDGEDLQQWTRLYSIDGTNDELLKFLDEEYLHSLQENRCLLGIEVIRCLPNVSGDSRIYDQLQRIVLNDESSSVRNRAALAICDLDELDRLADLLSSREPPADKRQLIKAIASVRNEYKREEKVIKALRYRKANVISNSTIQLINNYRNEIATTLFFSFVFGQIVLIFVSGFSNLIQNLLGQQSVINFPFDFFAVFATLLIGLYFIIRKKIANNECPGVKEYIIASIASSLLLVLINIFITIISMFRTSSAHSDPAINTISFAILNVLSQSLLIIFPMFIIGPFVGAVCRQRRILPIAIRQSVLALGSALLFNFFVVPFLFSLLDTLLGIPFHYEPTGVDAASIYGFFVGLCVTFAYFLGFQFGFRTAFIEKRKKSIQDKAEIRF